MNQGKGDEFRGKNLKDIEVTDDLLLSEEEIDDSEAEDNRRLEVGQPVTASRNSPEGNSNEPLYVDDLPKDDQSKYDQPKNDEPKYDKPKDNQPKDEQTGEIFFILFI